MNAQSLISLATLLLFAIGCEVPEVDTPPSAATQEAETPETETTAEKKDSRIDMSDVEGEPAATTSTPREFTAKDPKHGKLSRQAGGYLGSTVSKIPWAKNQTILLKIKADLETYNALHGDYPKTHEEFMDKFLKYSGITLPELEEGDEYLYDPEDHTLKIYRPEG